VCCREVPEDYKIEDKERLRQYLRSKQYRVCTWGSIGLLAASFVIPTYHDYLLYGAVILSFVAMLPALKLIGWRNEKLEFKNPRDRTTVLIVAAFVLGLIALTLLYVLVAR
jgi:hypothetical protein